jgi:hypothetical protein
VYAHTTRMPPEQGQPRARCVTRHEHYELDGVGFLEELKGTKLKKLLALPAFKKLQGERYGCK